MNDAEIKATLARLDADPTPCKCLVCWARTIGFGPKGTILTKPPKPAKVKP